MGVDRVTTLNLKVVQTDVERGLILVEGAVPGAKGGWITVRDAVKKTLPKDVPKPGKFKLRRDCALRRRCRSAGGRRRRRRARDMELKITSLDGKESGSVTLSDAIFGLEPRADLIHRCVVWQLAKRRAGTHEVKNRADIHRTGKKMYRQKGTGAPATARRASICSAAAAVRSVRWCAAMRSACRRRCARSRSSTRCRPRPRTAASSSSTRRAEGRQDQGAARRNSSKLGLVERADHRRRRGRCQRSPAARNIPNIDVLPVAGHQRLRHPAAAQAGADQGRGRCAGGAVQMSTTDPRHYDVILSPVITEKATIASEHNKVDIQGRAACDQAADQGSGGEALRRQGQERQHADPQGQGQGLPRPARRSSRTSSARS